MLQKLKVAAVAVVAAGLLGLGGASSAQAFNVGTHAAPIGSGSMAVTANAGASRLVINGSLPFSCTTTAGAGVINAGAFPNVYPQAVGTVQPSFSSCTWALGLAFTVSCASTSNLQVTATSPAHPATLGTVAGRITGISCLITFELGCTATATGTVPVSYRNGNGSTIGATLTVLIAGQSLVVSGSTCPAAVLPNGTAQFGAPGSGSGTALTNLTYNVGGAISGHPYISD